MIRLLVAIAFLGINAYTYHFMARDTVIPPRENLASFPMEIGTWRCEENEPIEARVLKNLGATDTLVCTYFRPEDMIGFYIGYHATQVREEGGGGGENAIHPPAHCLPGSGWDIVDSRTVPLDFEGLAEGAEAKRLIIAKGESRQLVYYWYQMQGRSIAEDWQKIVYMGIDRAKTGRTDGALVRVTIPLGKSIDPEADAEARFAEFAELTTPLLSRYVPD
jgi:EpsI family protein